ncbi:hypothetical protein [Streptomyces celluloflavus]|uniref:hypothetical protein n=1 Tax=Streptomyces celluloflavus TaxID=58344 RepID=UPI0036AFF9B9
MTTLAWVRLDDRFPSHRKVAMLSDRAFRLHVSALCWSAENLTDGVIRDTELRLVAHVRGMTATARQLEAAGLWERIDDGWMLHDFHDYNPSAEQVRAERERNAARQRRFRDRRPDPEAGSSEAVAQARNGVSNGVTNGVSHGVSNAAPSRTRPVPGSLPDGRELSVPAREHKSAAGVPGFAQALAEQLGAAGCHVRWETDSQDRETLRRLIEETGIEHLVEAARRAWNPTNPPRSIRYLLKVWDGLPPISTGSPAQPQRPSPSRSTAEQRAAVALDLAAKFRAEETPHPLARAALEGPAR